VLFRSPDVLRRDVLYPALERLGVARNRRAAGFHTSSLIDDGRSGVPEQEQLRSDELGDSWPRIYSQLKQSERFKRKIVEGFGCGGLQPSERTLNSLLF
jgi:hypothetical protein